MPLAKGHMENPDDWGAGYYGYGNDNKPKTHAYFITRLLMYGKLEENDFRGNLPRGKIKGLDDEGSPGGIPVGVDNMQLPNHQ